MVHLCGAGWTALPEAMHDLMLDLVEATSVLSYICDWKGSRRGQPWDVKAVSRKTMDAQRRRDGGLIRHCHLC